jgi:acetyltransferase-like isoleucine patch superfamily enzyme
LGYELRLVGSRPGRWLTMWFGSSVWVNASYRLDRCLYLIFGKVYVGVRPIFFPIFLLFALLGGRHEIHYRARIGRGLRILHPALGIVVSGKTIAGERLTLTGGNLIGERSPILDGDIDIATGVVLGANSVVLGPVKVGDRAIVGAGAVVVSDVPSGAVVVGVPAMEARPVRNGGRSPPSPLGRQPF